MLGNYWKYKTVIIGNKIQDELGFTAGISYLLAAVQGGKCQRWAVDQKLALDFP